jgi:acyl carrier protein
MDVAGRVISVIAKFKKIPEDSITAETTLESFGLDSLDGLNLIFELEEEFDITIPDEQALKLKSVGEIIENLEKLLASGDSEPAAD